MIARILPDAGARFGSWTFLGEYRGIHWKCQCVCGLVKWVQGGHVRSGASQSCRKCSATLHGGTGTKLYSIWTGIKTRCLREEHPSYRGYGARGITICDEWLTDFHAFAQYVGEPPSDRHTLDRIDNEGNYCPGNVKWSLPKQQARNRRDNRWITIRDETLCATDWCARTGISLGCARHRVIKLGWSWEKAVTTPAMDTTKNLPNQ